MREMCMALPLTWKDLSTEVKWTVESDINWAAVAIREAFNKKRKTRLKSL